MLLRELEDRDPPRERLGELLRSGDAATVHAVVLHLDGRLRRGEIVDRWVELLPADLTELPPESQLVLAALSAEGLGPPPPEPRDGLPPRVRLAWLRARLLDDPERLRAWEGTALGREAVKDVPVDRAVATGLLPALCASGDPACRLTGLAYLRAAAERGLVPLAKALEPAFGLAEDANAPVAAGALAFLREPWAFALVLPRALSLPGDVQVRRELVELVRARREVDVARRLLARDALEPALVGGLLAALGECGEAGDVTAILDRMQADPFRLGAAGLAALVAMKRRGISPGDDEARALLALYLEGPALDAAAAAEALSSRGDLVTGALEGPLEHDDPPPPWDRITALLEALGTARAIGRLRAIVDRTGERAGWWYAIQALGRLGVADAERDILARLDDQPQACLRALRLVGGEATLRVLGQRLTATGPAPPWLEDAARLAFELDPSPALFERLAERGLLTAEILGALPDQGAVAQAASLRSIARRRGHPLRVSALRALGRTGGPLAADVLGPVLGDPDEEVRREALVALRVLGGRLRASGSARPPHLDGGADAADMLVADTLLRSLRDRALAPAIVGRLLDALAGLSHAHPHLVPIVRPYLRHRSPAIRKRAVACLGEAGPAAAAWIAPSLADDDITVARQALLALGRIGATGLAAPIAAWLDQSNMNLKKTAAETLARAGDRTVAGRLLRWLAIHDNPGFRHDLAAALRSILGTWFRAVVIDRLAGAEDAHARERLIEALSGTLSAAELAAVVDRRGGSGTDAPHRWWRALAARAYEGKLALASGTTTDLDAALARRGIVIRIAAPSPDDKEAQVSRLHALRAGLALGRALRQLPAPAGVINAHLAVLHRANVSGQLIVSAWRSEIHALLDAYGDLDEEGRAGALQVLGVCDLDPVARLRTAEILIRFRPKVVPAPLARVMTDIMSVYGARWLADWKDRTVREAAARTLLLEELRPGEAWPDADPDRLFEHRVRAGAADAAFQWALERQLLVPLVRALRAVEGESATVARVRGWVERRPDVLRDLLPELARLGDAGRAELVRLARSGGSDLALRFRALELAGRLAIEEMRDELRALLDRASLDMRAQAANLLLAAGDDDDRRLVLESYLRGAFREAYVVALRHQDVAFLAAHARTVAGEARLRLARLVAHLDDPARVPQLLGLWRTGDDKLKAEARDLLRARPAAEVLPFIDEVLEEGDLSVLDVVGATRVIPVSIVERYARAADEADFAHFFESFFERMAGAGTLSAPGLAGVLARKLDGARDDRRAVRIFVRLDDWSDAARTGELAAVIVPALAGGDRDGLLRWIVESTADLDAGQRIRVLTAVGRPADRPVILALADVLLAEPTQRDALAAPMVAAIDQAMDEELDGEPERARRILGYRAARVRTDDERSALIDVLEAGLAHRSPRVRLHAHRLLRVHADRARYLSATRRLLGDQDPTAVRGAIRALTYGRHLDAVGDIAELVFHSNNAVRAAATDGLLFLGQEALPPLTRLLGRLRPDMRRTLSEIVERIQRGDTDAGALPAEDDATDESP